MALVQRLAGILRRFAQARAAVAAVEFALILPVALLLYVGAAEVGDGVMTSRKVTDVTRTLVDLLSHQSTSSQTLSTPVPPNAATAATLNTLMTSAQSLLYPQPLGSLQMTISAIDVQNTLLGLCCKATVRWSYTQNGTLRPCNVLLTGTTSATIDVNTLPMQLLPIGTVLPAPLSYLIADVSYTYQPIMSVNLLRFSPSMQRTEYMLPRSIGQVIAGTLPATGTQHGLVCY